MILKYTDSADALYIYLKPGVKTTRGEEIDNGTIVDLDDQGDVVGIEVLSPARDWPLEEIAERFPLDMADLLQLRTLWGEQNRVHPYVSDRRRPKTTATLSSN